jgi:cell wall-associated NlpC family hydrolase
MVDTSPGLDQGRAMCFLRPVLALLLLVFLGACSRNEVRISDSAAVSTPRSESARSVANAVLFRALALVGTPYRYGGNTPETGFDCSGLVGYVFSDAARIKLPRTSAELGAMDRPQIARRNLQSGDLVLFAAGKRIGHVGIYVGEGRFVHAPNSGGTVRLDRLDAPGWRETFSMGKRVIN